MDFPAGKDAIVEHARHRGADETQLRALRAMPRADYDNLAEVLRSVPVDPAPDRTGTEAAEQRRAHGQGPAGLAEYERDAAPSPIEQELDEG
ncbi:hypothetical protein ACRB68_28780 [Actinomadura sp. RB68]|uniref:DUF2795 domain-containing protein n=2 Tax=Actinomadura macrotermitis TaxID=2585200 RepID=A0A7K0BUT5_9ACTN|nr:hypothetical protein [Actinomadura macrotermitis]